MKKICSAISQPLFSVADTRRMELQAAAQLPPHALMQRAGLSVARLTLALAPHAQRIWVACGPGNNGGDGFEAALQLHQKGKSVRVSWTGLPSGKAEMPPDAHAARQRALAAGVIITTEAPDEFDFCIDALLGLGAKLDAGRSGSTLIQSWLDLMQAKRAPRLAVDLPTGLDADTGCSSASNFIAAHARQQIAAGLFTLSISTLKAGLFTADGRDRAGQVWFDDLGLPGTATSAAEPCAWLLGADRATPPQHTGAAGSGRARHASHKGTFGDVAILGGQSSATSHMTGAALLAARAALNAGAGRVFVAVLDEAGPADGARLTLDPAQPELMFRSADQIDMQRQVVVCGCGGGEAVKTVIAKVLSTATRAVLDADALNAIANDPQLQTQLQARHQRGYRTVLTPHPLEAARLAGTSVMQVQASRLTAARELAGRFQCVVVLKGSGTVIAAPGRPSFVNSTGSALLATAGTGDVLAGMIGAGLAHGADAFEAASSAVFTHGQLADAWAIHQPGRTLTASLLASLQ